MDKVINDELKIILGEDAINFGKMEISPRVSILCKAIYYLSGQMLIAGKTYVPEEDVEAYKEYIKIIFEKTTEILRGKNEKIS